VRLTTAQFQAMREAGEKIVMFCCYDASFAGVGELAGVEIFLVGDSLGMVVQGYGSTLPVSMEDMEYHVRAVARGSAKAMVMGDLPFGSYHQSPQQAFANAARLMAAGAGIVKLEGGRVMAPAVEFMVARGIPVCGHLGLTPQSVNTLGGYKVQGKTDTAAQTLLEDAKLLQEAGACMVVVEAVPADLGKRLTESLRIPTIGIGGGPHCSGQVLLAYDMLDIFPGKKAKFVKNFLEGAGGFKAAIENYVKAVKQGSFPGAEHSY
jgi:3-methyl-2-oxobutanoate hydroxymethyltransferase